MSGFPFVSVWDFCLLFRQLPFFFFFDKLALDPVVRAGLEGGSHRWVGSWAGRRIWCYFIAKRGIEYTVGVALLGPSVTMHSI